MLRLASIRPVSKPFKVDHEIISPDGAGIHVFKVHGELDMSTVPGLEDPLQKLDGNGVLALINLSECDFIDSTGVAVIIHTWRRLDREADGEGGGRLVLCCPDQQVRRLLEITGVESSISTHDSQDEALAELQAAV